MILVAYFWALSSLVAPSNGLNIFKISEINLISRVIINGAEMCLCTIVFFTQFQSTDETLLHIKCAVPAGG